MEFTEPQWHGLKQHADEKDLKFLSSPFSTEAVDLLTRVGVSAWKVASGEINNALLFERMAKTKLPIFISSGMSPLNEIDIAVKQIQAYELPFTILQCTSNYPCPPEKIGLNLISFFRERYKCDVGLSDHSGTIYPALAAATLGIQVCEIHVTLSREMFGPDVTSSITTTELRQLVEGIRFIETMQANPVDKDSLASSMAPLRDLFTKSVVPIVDLPRGTIIRQEHLTSKKPGTGIPSFRIKELVNRKVKRFVPADTLLSEDDFE
jgi:N-acetylneuraminate synthase